MSVFRGCDGGECSLTGVKGDEVWGGGREKGKQKKGWSCLRGDILRRIVFCLGKEGE